MGVPGYEDQSPIPESYAGPLAWWDPAVAKHAVILDRNLTGAEMLNAAGLDWNVSQKPLFVGDLVPVAPQGNTLHTPVEVPGWKGIYRDDTNAFLGMATATYHPVQNQTLADLADAILSAKGDEAHFHTAGSLYDGRIVWMQARIDRDLYVRGDDSPIADFLTLYTGHDGRHALTMQDNPTRIWCGNTMAQAMRNYGMRYVLRHTSNVMGRIDEVRKAIDLHVKRVEELMQVMNDLTTKPMTLAELVTFTEKLLPADPKVEHPYKTERMRADIAALFSNSPTMEGLPQTAYRAYQAVVEYTDHVKVFGDTKTGSGADRRAQAILEGSAYTLKSAALQLLVKA